MVIDHIRKSVIDNHLKSKKHLDKVSESPKTAENVTLRLQTMRTVIDHRTEANVN